MSDVTTYSLPGPETVPMPDPAPEEAPAMPSPPAAAAAPPAPGAEAAAAEREHDAAAPTFLTVADREYRCLPVVPAGYLMRVTRMETELSKATDPAERTGLLFDMVDTLSTALLADDELKRLQDDMLDRDNPIGLEPLVEALGKAFSATVSGGTGKGRRG